MNRFCCTSSEPAAIAVKSSRRSEAETAGGTGVGGDAGEKGEQAVDVAAGERKAGKGGGIEDVGDAGVRGCCGAAEDVDLQQAKFARIVAAVERDSEHPVAQAIVRGAADRGLARLTAEDFRAEPGLGVAATVAGRRVHVGTAGWLARAGIDTEALDTAAEALASRGRTPALVAVDGALVGLIAVADRPADGAREVVAALRDLGITVMMVTGDRPGTARAVAAHGGTLILSTSSNVPIEEIGAIAGQETSTGTKSPGRVSPEMFCATVSLD